MKTNMLKKGLLLGVVAVLMSFAAQAQLVSPFVRAGISFPSFSTNVEGVTVTSTTGFQGGVGAMVTLPILNLEFEPSIHIATRGATMESKLDGGKVKISPSLLYVDIPVMINLPITIAKTGVFVGIGGAYGCALKGSTKVNDTKKDIDFSNDYSRTDFFFRAHAGVRIFGNQLALSWERGLLNISEVKGVKMYNNGLCLSYAYIF